MGDIFISYSRPDRDKAAQLASIFERQGWSVWWDRELAAGNRFAEVIAAELASAKAVVTLWSQSSVASNWVKDEAQEGATRNALVPVLLDKTNLPLGFRQFQAADLSGWDGSDSHPEIAGLLRAVAEQIKRPYTPPAPVGPPRRLTWLYAAVGVALVGLLGFAAYRWLTRDTGPGPNVDDNRVAVGNDNNSQGKQGATGCDGKASRDAADLTGKGLTYIDKDGNHAAAILQFNEAIRVCADYADAYFYRGQSYAVLGKKERAISDFNKVIQLSSDPATDQDAQALIASLSVPAPTPMPRPTPNKVPSNTNTTAAPTPTPTPPGPQNTNGTTTAGLKPIPVRDIFASDRATRINATTRLIVEKKRDAGAVKEAVNSALADPDNKSGVINTLVFLENVDPSILKQYKPEIDKLLAVAEKNGSQTQEHIKKVRERMGG